MASKRTSELKCTRNIIGPKCPKLGSRDVVIVSTCL